MIRNSIIVLLFLVFVSGFSQTNLNKYKYVIVPNQYDFLNKADQFQLNSLSEFLFNKYGFVALMEGSEFPEDLKNDRCLALTSNVINDKKLFKTILTIILKDCNNKEVYKSKEGESREKEYKIAYNQALRGAFKSLSTLNHKYEPTTKNSVASSQLPTVIEQKNLDKVKEEKIDQPIKTINTPIVTNNSNILYAQAIDNGFQLVDSKPKVVYRMLKTSKNSVFLVEGKAAIIYESNGKWLLEFYENGNQKQEVLNIKF